MMAKYIYTKGYVNCPTCDSPSFSDEIIFDKRELLDILYNAWEESDQYRFSNIYSIEGLLVCEFYYTYSRHSVSGLKCKVPNGKWVLEDDGSGNKIFQFYED
jgi:hypothetical protein